MSHPERSLEFSSDGGEQTSIEAAREKLEVLRGDHPDWVEVANLQSLLDTGLSPEAIGTSPAEVEYLWEQFNNHYADQIDGKEEYPIIGEGMHDEDDYPDELEEAA